MPQGLSVIIVNYKSVALIQQCLRSFVGSMSIYHWEVIVVDNNSGDAFEQQLTHEFPFVKCLQMGYNAGFARANNRGIAAAAYETVLLLNADTIIQNDAIYKCYNRFVDSPYVACGVQLFNADGSTQISGSYVMKGGLNYLLMLPYLGAFLGKLAKSAKVRKPSIEVAAAVEEVEWINGAFLMVKKESIQKAGALDEDFFLYAEEIEWCSRLHQQGRMALFGNLQVVHLQGETTKDFFGAKKKGYQNLSDKMGQQLMLSTWVRQRKQFGLFWLLVLLFFYGIEIPIFGVCLCIGKLFGSQAYSFTDFTGYTGNYFRNLAFIPALVLKKPCFYKVI